MLKLANATFEGFNIACNPVGESEEIKCSGTFSIGKNIKGTSQGILLFVQLNDLIYAPIYKYRLERVQKCNKFLFFKKCRYEMVRKAIDFTPKENELIYSGIYKYLFVQVYGDALSHL